MEYKILTPNNEKYPEKLKQRFGTEVLSKIYYNGNLAILDRFTMSVLSADSIHAPGLIAANQSLFTIREYEMNYLGPCHSVMEMEIFRLGLFRQNTTVTLFTSKGLEHETYESFLKDRFFPPFDKFYEKKEYFRRVEAGEMLILSVSEPAVSKFIRKNIMHTNFIIACLGDIIFFPYGVKSSKTYIIAKRIIELNLPAFTTDDPANKDLHNIGVPGYNRANVHTFLESHGAKLSEKPSSNNNKFENNENNQKINQNNQLLRNENKQLLLL